MNSLEAGTLPDLVARMVVLTRCALLTPARHLRLDANRRAFILPPISGRNRSLDLPHAAPRGLDQVLARLWKMERTIKFIAVLGASGLALAATAQEPVVISEIMYAPVEAPAFNPDGTPVMDLTEEVHEYVELHNFGSNRVDLSGWRLTSAIHYTFPAGASIGPGEFLVVARDPARLASVSAYGLAQASLYGPYSGQLSNQGETLKLRNALDEKVDTVTYSSAFPCAISANALGVGQRWTGVAETNYLYRGRSLERVSFTASGDNPANWLASPLPGEPSPGKPNAVHRDLPLPVVVQLSVCQAGDGQPMIRPNQAVQVAAVFSATNELGSVQLEVLPSKPECYEPADHERRDAAGWRPRPGRVPGHSAGLSRPHAGPLPHLGRAGRPGGRGLPAP